MPIEFACPTCQTQIRTPDTAAGKMARCPRCQTITAVPQASASTIQPFVPETAFPQSPLANPLQPLPANFNPPDPSFGFSDPPPNPSPPAVPWLPPAAAFQPVGQQLAGPIPGGMVQGAQANPFGDLPAGAGGTGDLQNPYASPAGFAAQNVPYSSDEARSKLLGPAIGISVSAILSLGLVLLFTVVILVDEGFHREIQGGGDPLATTFGYIFFALMIAFAAAPAICSLMGAWAMFRGRGLVTAWLGLLASFVPCSPCFLFSLLFSIWGIIVLSDSRVSSALR